ncbi:3-oxoacyl-ACP reductase FabG [Cytobacillus purgationiresistens]|uniref:3-oxoacyl-[acyl-carrier protein] reductase n=1 Tax=Cytobacillus purgationiresistens TaxID=863449 RepID=A0ABU0APP5_9BACI|nr:3-oxoacyl-ACP reductase FabG [Cytobacillus purgationiresistens]MDQ0273000.1 3-oxoacyl-[acyl-carrier protein] reductase [Cytobacillus purgationiresistens]
MFKGQKIIVTGGSRGIGRATVEALAKEGAEVAFTYHNNHAAAEEVYQSTNGYKGSVQGFQSNAKSLIETKAAVTQMKKHLNGLDALVINAGIVRDAPLIMMNEEDWDNVISTNLGGTFNYAKSVIFEMMKQKKGRIICITSVSGIKGIPGQTNYAASKAAQIGFVRSLSKETARYNILVNAIAPGFIETDMWHNIDPEKQKEVLKEVPLRRPGTLDEISGTVKFLLSPAASYMTGTVLVMDGGISS